MKRRSINNTAAARRRAQIKCRHTRMLRRQKLFFNQLQVDI